MSPTAEYKGRFIFVAVIESSGEYHAVPVVCPAGETPHGETARRLTLEETFATRDAAEAAAIRTARRLDRLRDPRGDVCRRPSQVAWLVLSAEKRGRLCALT